METIDLIVDSVDTYEKFNLHKIDLNMSVLNLKIDLELLSGIPAEIQRITYLDDGEMIDESILRSHEIVDGGRIKLSVWKVWKGLVQASAHGYVDEVLKEGVDETAGYESPNTLQMSSDRRHSWFKSRAFISLMVATHKGHLGLVKMLLQRNAPLYTKTKHARNVLHIGAANEQNACLKHLLFSGGANLMDKVDCNGLTPIECSAKYQSNTSSAYKILHIFEITEKYKSRLSPVIHVIELLPKVSREL